MMEDKLKKRAIISYGLGISTGAQFIGAVVATYVLVFMTDTFGVPAAAAGVIMLIATIWDALDDPLIGTMADRTKSRWGRYRPYLLFVPIPLTIVSILLFAAPEFSTTGKIAYAAILYICYGILTTLIQLPFGALLPAMTRNPQERTKVVQVYTFIASIVILVSTSFTTVFVEILGGEDVSKGYMILIGIAGVCMIITSFLTFINCKEKYVEEKEAEPLKVSLKKLLKQKELLPVLIVWCMGCLGFQVMMSSSVYYVMYYLGRPDLIPVYMLQLSVAGMIGIIIMLPVFMKLFKGNVKTGFMISQIISAVCSILVFFLGTSNIALLFVLSFVGALFATMSNAYIPLVCVEMIDYIQYKTGEQLNATITAIRGFAYKCGGALANGTVGITLGATGYVAGNIGGQTTMALFGINACRWMIPVVAAVVLCLCLIPYPVTDVVKQEIACMQEKNRNEDK